MSESAAAVIVAVTAAVTLAGTQAETSSARTSGEPATQEQRVVTVGFRISSSYWITSSQRLPDLFKLLPIFEDRGHGNDDGLATLLFEFFLRGIGYVINVEFFEIAVEQDFSVVAGVLHHPVDCVHRPESLIARPICV